MSYQEALSNLQIAQKVEAAALEAVAKYAGDPDVGPRCIEVFKKAQRDRLQAEAAYQAVQADAAEIVTPAALANAFVAMQAAEVKLDEIRSAYKAAQYVGKTEARIIRPILDEATAEYEAATRAYTGLADAFEAQGKAYLQQDKITIRSEEEWAVIEHYRSVLHDDLARMFAKHGYTEAVASKSRELDKFLSALKRWSADEALERTIRATDILVETTYSFLNSLRGTYREDEIAEFKPFLVAAIRASKRNDMITSAEHLDILHAAYTALKNKLDEAVAA